LGGGEATRPSAQLKSRTQFRGLASLIDSAMKDEDDAEPVDQDALYFIAQELRDPADVLEGAR
jgi:hypothetical protein